MEKIGEIVYRPMLFSNFTVPSKTAASRHTLALPEDAMRRSHHRGP
jgi:hypothetical protein